MQDSVALLYTADTKESRQMSEQYVMAAWLMEDAPRDIGNDGEYKERETVTNPVMAMNITLTD